MLVYRAVFLLLLIMIIPFSNTAFNGGEMAALLKEETFLKMNAQTIGTDLNEITHAIGIDLEENAQTAELDLTEGEALDLVKESYATNFIKVYKEDGQSYYYRLEIADYYLVCEGLVDNTHYLIHLYEFVVDEEESGVGHTVTYGWYTVEKGTGQIEERSL